MALFNFNSRLCETLSVCFACLCNSMHRKLRCVGSFNRYGTYQLVNDIRRARKGNACVRICSVTQQSSRTELHFMHRVPYSFGWIASPATRNCLSWHWISWRILAASQAYVERLFSLCDLTARKRNSTKVSLCRRVFLKLNS